MCKSIQVRICAVNFVQNKAYYFLFTWSYLITSSILRMHNLKWTLNHSYLNLAMHSWILTWTFCLGVTGFNVTMYIYVLSQHANHLWRLPDLFNASQRVLIQVLNVSTKLDSSSTKHERRVTLFSGHWPVNSFISSWADISHVWVCCC